MNTKKPRNDALAPEGSISKNKRKDMKQWTRDTVGEGHLKAIAGWTLVSGSLGLLLSMPFGGAAVAVARCLVVASMVLAVALWQQRSWARSGQLWMSAVFGIAIPIVGPGHALLALGWHAGVIHLLCGRRGRLLFDEHYPGWALEQEGNAEVVRSPFFWGPLVAIGALVLISGAFIAGRA